MILGTPGDDVLSGSSADDVFCAGAGNDVISGGGGDDTVYAGAGDDSITTGAGRDTVIGGSGADHIVTYATNDVVYGDEGPAYSADPTDTSPDGADVIFGGTGSDSIEAGGGNDMVFTGGDGESALGSVSITHGGPGNDIIVSDFRQVTRAEYFYGDEGDDLLWPNPFRTNVAGNFVYGGKGNDVMIIANALRDWASRQDGRTNVSVPVGSLCKVTVDIPDGAAPGTKGNLSCTLPIKARVPGLTNGGAITASVDSGGKIQTLLSFKPSAELQSLLAWRSVAAGGFPADLCICDPDLTSSVFVGDKVTE